MRIEILDGTYNKDAEAAAFLKKSEQEYLASLAQKLVVRKTCREESEKKLQEEARQKEACRLERERVKLEKQREAERIKRETINRLLNGGAM